MQQKLIFVFTLLASLLAACATAPTASTSANPANSLNSPLVAVPAQANAPRGAVLLEIERSGGIAGKTERKVMYANGELTVNETTMAHLGSDAAQKLVADLTAAGFFTLQDSYRSRCNDCYQYRITLTSATQTKTVSYVEDGQLSAEVTKVINELKRINE